MTDPLNELVSIDNVINNINETPIKKSKPRSPPVILQRFYQECEEGSPYKFEICIDEAGRGCLFGRVYIACVVLPKDPQTFDGKNIKDSKKFSSKKKISEVASYIKDHALAWHIAYVEPAVIDEINILKAVMQGMHECIREIVMKITKDIEVVSFDDFIAVIDGNYFTPFRQYDNDAGTIREMPFVTVEQGDAKYMGIAAASILAKTARDAYVLELCSTYPILDQRYGLCKNMGYGTKAHLDGIREFGITQWHRRTFGEACKHAIITHMSKHHNIYEEDGKDAIDVLRDSPDIFNVNDTITYNSNNQMGYKKHKVIMNTNGEKTLELIDCYAMQMEAKI